MDRPEKHDSMQLTEELQFVTACLIGHVIKVQTKSFLLSGMLIAANFDKDYGVVLNVGGKEVHHGKIKILLKDIAYISAENVSLDLDKDVMLESCMKTSHSKDVHLVSQSSAGQSGENTVTTERDVTSSASSTNIVPDQKASDTYPPNSFSQLMIPVMLPAQTDNSFQGVQSQPTAIPVLYQPPNNYGVQRQYPNAGGQFVTYAPQHYMQAGQHLQGYMSHFDPQVQGYIYQPQYPPGSQNTIPLNQAPRGHQGPR